MKTQGQVRLQRRDSLFTIVCGSDLLLWLMFLVAHLVPVLMGLFVVRDHGFGDVGLYHHWMREGLSGDGWPVVDDPWVYPFGAILPMIVLAPIHGTGAYILAWIALAMLMNAGVLVMIEEYSQSSRTASWWWVLSITLLGPVALGRLESVMVPITVVAVLLLFRRPALAAALLTVAAWIKVFPALWLVPLILSDIRRSKRIIVVSVSVSVSVIATAFALGGGSRIFSFLTAQADRGLQVEAVPASLLQAARLWGSGVGPEFNADILTWQFEGEVADALGLFITIATLPAVLGLLWIVRRALVAAPQRHVEILALALLASALTLVVFNKVGSPQYLAWLSAPIILGLVIEGRLGSNWRRWAIVVLLMNLMTQLIYPHFYMQLITGEPVMVMVVVLRNVLLVGLLVAVSRELIAVKHPITQSRASRLRRDRDAKDISVIMPTASR